MEVIWNVSPVGYQLITKRCPSCNVKRDFAPSGAFRVNSQKKTLDIWSIYKCVHCDYTWNITLFSRVHVSKISSELYSRLITNDEATAQLFSNDYRILNKNKAKLSGSPEFIVKGQRGIASLTPNSEIKIRVLLTSPFQINLLSIIKKHLSVSSGEIKLWVETGKITGVTVKALRTKKFNQLEYSFGIAVELNALKNDRTVTGDIN